MPGSPRICCIPLLVDQKERAHRVFLAAELLLTELVEREPRSCTHGALGNDRLAGLCELLQTGGGVDGDAGDDRLTRRRIERRDRLARVDRRCGSAS